MSEAANHENRRHSTGLDVDGTKVSFGGRSADRGDLLASYAAVLRAVREARPGAELPLRTEDLEVLATAVGADGHDVEARIRSLLGCTPAEAKRVHRELVKRRLLRPVAMLAVGSAIVWGPAAAASGDRPTLGEFQERPTETIEPALPGIPLGATTTPLPTTTSPSSTAPMVTPSIEPTGSAAPTLPAEPIPAAAIPAAAIAEPNPAEAVPPPSTPDVGIPAGETPTVIIAS